ncbi:unnamed protein product [Brassica oleracea]
MEEMLGGLRNILTTVFLSAFAGYLVSPVMTDVTVSAVCSDLNDSCSLAVYLTGLQQVRNSEQGFFYTFYVVKTLFDLICQGTVDCLAQAYVAKNIHGSKRMSMFGVLAGVTERK